MSTAGLSLSSSPAVCSPSLVLLADAAGNGRKRRAGPALQLSRINLGPVSKLSGSNESLSSVGEGAQTPSGSEECVPIGSQFASSSAAASDSEGGGSSDPLKRQRLCSQSQSDSDTESLPISGGGAHPESEWLPFGGEEHQQQQAKARPRHLSLSELDSSAGEESPSASARNALLASGGLVIGDAVDGWFELVGDGRNCKAVDMHSQTVHHCQVMKSSEFKVFAEVMARMQSVAKYYHEEDFRARRDLLIPVDQVRVVKSPRAGLVYVLLPDHFGNLHHQLIEEEMFGATAAAAAADAGERQSAAKQERRMQPILKQVGALLELCHRCGVYFRDFRLRKFVFTDAQRTKIRVNNVLDLFLAPDPSIDRMTFREFTLAYVAPEVLDKKNDCYSGRAADIWAFGVLMFTLLNNRYPFFESSPSPILLLRRIVAGKFSFPIRKSVSDQAKWLLHSLLRQNPADRPSAEELLTAHWFHADPAPEREGKEQRNPNGSPQKQSPAQSRRISPSSSSSTTPSALQGRISPPNAQVPTRQLDFGGWNEEVVAQGSGGEQQRRVRQSQRTLARYALNAEHAAGGAAQWARDDIRIAEERRRLINSVRMGGHHQRTTSENNRLASGQQQRVGRAPSFVPVSSLWSVAPTQRSSRVFAQRPPGGGATGGHQEMLIGAQRAVVMTCRGGQPENAVAGRVNADQVVPSG